MGVSLKWTTTWLISVTVCPSNKLRVQNVLVLVLPRRNSFDVA